MRVRRELDLGDEADEALRVVDRHAAGLGQPGHGAVQQARVAEAVADARAPRPRRRCSCPSEPGPSRATTSRSMPPKDTVSRAADPGARRSASAPAARRPRPRTSGALSGRTAPLRRPSRRTGPMRTRTSRCDRRADGAEHPPQLALPALGQRRPVPGQVGRRRRSQQLRAAARPRPRSSAAGRRAWRGPRRAGSRPAAPSTWSPSSGAASADRVLALDAVARMEHAVGPVAVVGQQQQPLRVLVEPADRVEPRAVGHERGRDEVEDGRLGVAVARRGGDAGRLVQQQVGHAPRPRR